MAATYLATTDNTSNYALLRRAAAGVPPGSLSGATTGPGITTHPQVRGCYDRTRNRFISWGFNGTDHGFVVIDATTLAQVNFFPVTGLSGVHVGVAWDPVGDRYYSMMRSFSGAGSYHDYYLVSQAPDGTGQTSVLAGGGGKITGANIDVDICERPDSNAGVATLDFGTDGKSYIQLLDPDGTSHYRTVLPADTNHTASSYQGVAIARPKNASYLAVMYFSGWAFTGGVIGGTWAGGTWLSQWTAPLPDTSYTPGVPYSPLGVFIGSPYMDGVLTPDTTETDVVWYGSSLPAYADTDDHYLIFKITSGVATDYNLGEWQYSTRVLIASGVSGIPPLRQWSRNDGLRSVRRQGAPGPTSRQGSIRRGPAGNYT